MNKLGLIVLGVIFIVIGVLVKDQSWTRPEMFAGLQLDLGKTITNVGIFLVFIPVINMYFYVPLKEAMDARNHELESTFTEAEQLRTQMQTLKADYEARLIKTEAEARETIQNQIKEAQNLRQQLMSEAADRADALIRSAQAEIEQEKNQTIATIRTHVVDLTLAAAEKVIGENMDSDKNRRLIAEFIETVEVAS